MKKFFDDIYYSIWVWASKGYSSEPPVDLAATGLWIALVFNFSTVVFFLIGVNDWNELPNYQSKAEPYAVVSFFLLFGLALFLNWYFLSTKRYKEIINEREGMGYLKTGKIYFLISFLSFFFASLTLGTN